MIKKDYYQILGISKTANSREIKKSYKKLAMKYHPDRNQGNKNSEKKFKIIKEAYEILINPQKREAYDQYGHANFEYNNNNTENPFENHFSHSNADFGDIFGDVFSDIFGNSHSYQKKNQKGSDLQYNLEINLEESVQGTSKEILIPSTKKCTACYGSGSKLGKALDTCHVCHGRGQTYTKQGFFTVQQTCSYCQGKGKIITNPCLSCQGKGKVPFNKKILVNIPSGIETNDKIKIPNEGQTGPNRTLPGDLYVQIIIKKHPIFERKENNLYCDIPINFCMAVLGGTIEVPTLHGKIKIKIPSETQSGKLLRIKGKGIHSIRTNKIGDLICRIIVETPVQLNEKQKNIIKKLEKSLNYNNQTNNNPKSKRFFDGIKKFFENLTK
ncbi:molecular chaperone DnaJ [Buchnera aphidicola]|uniref:Chaperone protein DnaJ n=1 Tax=Buchnera aphidicola (Stegophylla sp.) TaxID=2315800 RepID=A0A4D6YKC7_9GAMM|nr:molecular chaperone DnaJ [Buchnera aphidicola (Stegophylla sp.)]QCI26290.1 molecular chaperone DnaJ [Buchnera aphidicola (Stegophylla sp.)]